jgi:hypothetical protein
MFGIPLSHPLVRPSPLEWVSIQSIVLVGCGHHMVNELPAIFPRAASKVVETEIADQQLRLIEP